METYNIFYQIDKGAFNVTNVTGILYYDIDRKMNAIKDERDVILALIPTNFLITKVVNNE